MDFADPVKNIAQFGLKEGGVVADLGAGSGHYTLAASEKVGSTGVVYAVDVQKELLDRVVIRAKEEGAGNIEIVWGDIEEMGGSRLKDGSVDAVIISNTLFQVEDKKGLAAEADRILKNKGRVLVIDWDGSYDNLGPTEEAVYKASDARALFENKGYIFESDINAGAYHYGFSMSKV